MRSRILAHDLSDYFHRQSFEKLPLALMVQIGLAAFVAHQAAKGLHSALVSAEVSAAAARDHAEEARRHRAELQQAQKSLCLANYQLQRANAELFSARDVAEAAMRFKSDFAAQSSHEFRTSLNLILGFSETMAFSQHTYGARLPAGDWEEARRLVAETNARAEIVNAAPNGHVAMTFDLGERVDGPPANSALRRGTRRSTEFGRNG